VMVVDDEPDILLAARLMLEAIGCRVIEARSGEQALELVERGSADVDAIFLDLRMPGIDGWAVLHEFRIRGIVRLPVIVLSAYCDPIAVEQSVELGAAGYLSKPFCTADLTYALEAVFEPGSDSTRTFADSAGTP
jgi:CheY-like chemotaxis protein